MRTERNVLTELEAREVFGHLTPKFLEIIQDSFELVQKWISSESENGYLCNRRVDIGRSESCSKFLAGLSFSIHENLGWIFVDFFIRSRSAMRRSSRKHLDEVGIRGDWRELQQQTFRFRKGGEKVWRPVE